MTRNKVGLIAMGAIAAVGLAGIVQISDRAQEGKTLCISSAGLTYVEAERLNKLDGLKPDQPFSVDDYCGTQCRPGSFGWQACLDGCREYCE